eukprot:5251567-Alexandrium_andersonii.AAC.1
MFICITWRSISSWLTVFVVMSAGLCSSGHLVSSKSPDITLSLSLGPRAAPRPGAACVRYRTGGRCRLPRYYPRTPSAQCPRPNPGPRTRAPCPQQLL